ncbi:MULTISPECIES: ArgP/LysG family DNA-binding transcriptional regulator [Dermacoccus]
MFLQIPKQCFIYGGAMRVRDDHFKALVACVDEGTFDGAAAALRITPSAVSQRVKALEQELGQIVLVRSVPVRPTPVGEIVLRTGRQRALLDAELVRALGGGGSQRGVSAPVVDLPVAVNADSLATWFVEVLETVGEWGDARLRVFVEDQDHSAQLLRDGSVIGAVTASDVAVQGCSVQELGVMRYVARVRRSQWEACGRSLERVPTVRFNDRDDLQRGVLRRRGLGEPPLEHVVPSAEGFSAAVRAGLGWGMIPEGLEGPAGRGGGRDELIPVPGVEPLDVPLYWQCWRLDAPSLARLSDEVTSAAHALR